jgi:hypothetical protein
VHDKNCFRIMERFKKVVHNTKKNASRYPKSSVVDDTHESSLRYFDNQPNQIQISQRYSHVNSEQHTQDCDK